MIADTPVMRRQRARLLRDHIAPRCRDEAVLAAMASLPRHCFLPADAQGQAHVDAPLPIGQGQTISQPSLVAHMLALLRLRPGMRVLDVGAGSGYVCALLAIVLGPQGRVIACERIAPLLTQARTRLEALATPDWAAIACHHHDASQGFAPAAPYDAIHVGAARQDEDADALIEQLALGGRLVQPITRCGEQLLQIVERRGDGLQSQDDWPVRFVPLLPGTT